MTGRHIRIIVCLLLVLLAAGLECFRELTVVARKTQVNSLLKSLATEIQIFRVDQGHYPQALPQLLINDSLDDRGTKRIRELLQAAQDNSWHDIYEYRPSTNGFTLTVTGPKVPPAGWFGFRYRVEKHYGEELKSLNSLRDNQQRHDWTVPRRHCPAQSPC
jgi:hypothetical protein